MESVLINFQTNYLKFSLSDEEVGFDICEPIKQQREMSILLIVVLFYKDLHKVSIEQ